MDFSTYGSFDSNYAIRLIAKMCDFAKNPRQARDSLIIMHSNLASAMEVETSHHFFIKISSASNITGDAIRIPDAQLKISIFTKSEDNPDRYVETDIIKWIEQNKKNYNFNKMYPKKITAEAWMLTRLKQYESEQEILFSSVGEIPTEKLADQLDKLQILYALSLFFCKDGHIPRNTISLATQIFSHVTNTDEDRDSFVKLFTRDGESLAQRAIKRFGH